MAVESLVSITSGAMESSLSPKFTEINTETSEKALMPKFSETASETNKSKDMPVFKDDTLNIQKDEKGYIRTRNEGLEGQNHPVTNVPFKEKMVVTDSGEEVIGVFPEFDSVFEAQLPENLYTASDSKQFSDCNNQLKDAIETDAELAKLFDEEQIDQINNDDIPDGYIWHHNEETGKMQLVDSEIHAKTGHTGGRSIWGGGSENR